MKVRLNPGRPADPNEHVFQRQAEVQLRNEPESGKQIQVSLAHLMLESAADVVVVAASVLALSASSVANDTWIWFPDSGSSAAVPAWRWNTCSFGSAGRPGFRRNLHHDR